MARLPQPGGDDGQWGDLLNDYLSVAHNADGTIKTGAVSNASIQNDAVTVAKIATTGVPSSGQALTYNGTDLSWSTVSGSGSVPDANASTKGIIQLTGDLGGTAASPTVPGLSGKEATITAGTTAQYYRGDKSWQTLNKAAVGLNNVDNTTDAGKPISTATQAALDAKAATAHTHNANDIDAGTFAPVRLPQATASAIGAIQLTGDLGGTATAPTVPGLSGKENTISAGTTAQYYRGDKSWQTLDKASVGLSNVDNTSDANKPVSTATQTAISGKENTVAAGTTAQYYRGDKSWQTLDKTAVGLANVDNTSDANKPISTATQTALTGKASSTHTHAAADIASGTIAAARLPIATDSATGIAQLATGAETVTGTDTAKVVTPAGVKAALDAKTTPIVFVNTLNDLPPGTPVDTLVVVRAV